MSDIINNVDVNSVFLLPCNHRWGCAITVYEPDFHIAWGATRTCRLCGEEQYMSYGEGYNGGPWRTTKQGTVRLSKEQNNE